MIKYIKGDIIKEFNNGDYACLLHQANCHFLEPNQHGAGVAKTISDKFSKMVKMEKESLKENRDNFYFGSYFSCEVLKGKYIVNLYSQFYKGNPNRFEIFKNKYFNEKSHFKNEKNVELYDNLRCRLNALKHSLNLFKKDFDNSHKLIIPLIASGLAKDLMYKQFNDETYFKNIVKETIETTLPDYDITVVIYQKF